MLNNVIVDEPLWMWPVFLAIVLLLMLFDLGVLHRKQRVIGIRESMLMSAFYILIGVSFGGFIWLKLGEEAASIYLTGYLVEKMLSMDNIFVMSLIFAYLQVPREYQHRVLFWGILGVIFLRGIMIGLGSVIVSEFEWVLYLFAAFLIYTGIKMVMMTADEAPMDVSKNRLLKWLRKTLPITNDFHGKAFWVKLPHAENPNRKVRYYTPLFVALILIEVADIVFAVDSIPAIFAITTDPFIVYTSNIFAILGLRALYFALAAMLHRFEYLKYALSVILIFIGGKVFVADFMGIEKVPASVSLGVTGSLLALGVIVSLIKTNPKLHPPKD